MTMFEIGNELIVDTGDTMVIIHHTSSGRRIAQDYLQKKDIYNEKTLKIVAFWYAARESSSLKPS